MMKLFLTLSLAFFLHNSSFAGKIDTSRFEALNKVFKKRVSSSVNLKDGIKEGKKLLTEDVNSTVKRKRNLGQVLSLPYRCSMKTKKPLR